MIPVALAFAGPPAFAVGSDGPGEHAPAPETQPVRELEDTSIFEFLQFGHGYDPVMTVERVAPLFGSRWLGWRLVGEGASQVLELLVNRVAPEDDDLLAVLLGAPAKYVNVVLSRYSYEELVEFKETVLELAADDPVAAEALTMVGIDTVRAQVTAISTVPLPHLQSSAERIVPKDAIDFQVDPANRMRVLDSYESYPPYKAGKRVKDKEVGSCTSGFVLRHRYTGTNYGSFAGHCTFPNNHVWTDYDNRDRIGYSFNDWEDNRNPVRSDSALITIDNQSHATNKLYVNSGLTRSVTGLVSRSSLVRGFPVCTRGYRSGVVCGSIQAVNVSVLASGVLAKDSQGRKYSTTKRFDHQTCWGGVTRPGDSGGPVYWIPRAGKDPSNAWAVGLNSTGGTNTSCFEPVYNVLGANGGVFSLRTW